MKNLRCVLWCSLNVRHRRGMRWRWAATPPANPPQQQRCAKPKSLLRGDLTDPHAPVIVALSEAAKRKETSPAPQRFDLDIAELNGVNDVCGTLLAGALAALRRKGAVIVPALDATIRRLSAPLKTGERTRKGQWYLVLELLQWSAQTATFDDRAVDFAVTFGSHRRRWKR